MNAGAKTFPIATSGCSTLVAPVQVSRSLPSLALTRAIVALLKLAAQISAPSDLAHWAPLARLVRGSTVSFCGIQNFPAAALGLPRFRTESTVRARKAAIWRRVTLAAGS